MNSSASKPKLPLWIFIATDLALLGAAGFIAAQAQRPLSHEVILWIVACVLTGAIVGLVPLIMYFERVKNEELDERQRALEALSRTVSSSAEQISIAAGSLHDIADLAQKNLRHADQLPHKLQEKIAEFQAQLAQAADTDKEELERELLALRTTESERLETVSQRIAKSCAEWTKLEAATQQHLAAAIEALGKLSLGTASAIGKAQAAAEQALAQARVEAARHIGEAAGENTRALEAARTATLAEFDRRLAHAVDAFAERLTADLASRIPAKSLETAPPFSVTAAAQQAPASPALGTTPETVAAAELAAIEAGTTATRATASTGERAPEADKPAPTTAAEAISAKRTRKPRPDSTTVLPKEVAAEAAAATASSAPETATVPTHAQNEPPMTAASGEPPPEPPSEIANIAEEPPPIPRERIVEITPIVPETTAPFAVRTPVSSALRPLESDTHTASAEAEKAAPRKRASRKAEQDEEPSLDLGLDEPAPAKGNRVSGGAETGERGLSSDGATRLLVTAYIGIGNRLFIRGSGPGLSWERGAPLQFISIGKWRWETNDATSAIQFKLYKNDEVECAALGAQTLEPGYQQELTAAF